MTVEAILLHIETIVACETQLILQVVAIFQMLTTVLSKFQMVPKGLIWIHRVDEEVLVLIS